MRRPSVNPMGRTDLASDVIYESRVTDFLEAELKSLGVRYTRTAVAPGRDNLVAYYTPPTPSSVTLLWEAHQDTVPVDAMTIPPFGGEVRDGKLWGRGACDVKAGIAVMLSAFAQLVHEKPPGSANVILAFTVDEEHTFLGVQALMNAGVRADFAIVAEPTGLNVVTCHKGVVRWRIDTHGRACHSSRPEQGISAVYTMAKIVTALEEYATQLQTRTPHPRLGPPTLSVGMIVGGVSPNTVPDRCSIEIDRRVLPGEVAAEVIADCDAFLRQRIGSAVEYQTHLNFACPAMAPTAEGNPHLAQLGACINRVVGSHELHAVAYGTDASTMSEAGMVAVVFGPGDIAQAHTRDEWIAVDQLAMAVKILVQFARIRDSDANSA